jgi:subtilisin family serine protease
MKSILSIRVKICMVILGALLLGWAVSADAQDRRRIVIFVDGTSVSVQELTVTLSGSTITDTLSLINALAIELPLTGIQDALAFLLNQTVVAGVFNDPVGFASAVTAVPAGQISEEIYDWGEERIGIRSVHQNDPEVQGAGVTIAILDTGIDSDHPDLQSNIDEGYNTFHQGALPEDGNGHGTHIAGIIAAAANGQGVIGIAPQARIRAIKVLDNTGAGRLSKLIKGMGWVYDHHIRLANMSLQFSEDSIPLQRATRRLYDAGVIMVAAAGNRTGSSATTADGGGSTEGGGEAGENTTSACTTSTDDGGSTEGGGEAGENTTSACTTSQLNVQYPGRYPWVIAVAATDYENAITGYSLSGPAVDLAAPGGTMSSERILSTNWGGSYGLASGTSQATAHVTGCIALALQRKSGLSFSQVLSLLQRTAGDLGYPETQQGAGLIDGQQMVEILE